MNSFKSLSTTYKILFICLLLVVIGLGAWSISMYKELGALKNPTAASEAEVKAAVAAVGKLIILPDNETPTLATVSDPSKLRNQPFFANAASGDKVLIYTNSRKAILWRPSVQKIIEVSALNIPAATTTPTLVK